MPDKFFFPFAAILAALMVAAALLYGGGQKAGPALDPRVDGYVLTGEALRELVPSPGTTLDFAGDAEQPVRYAVAAAHMTREAAPPSAGLFGELGPEFEAAFGGQALIVTVRARQGRDAPSERFFLNYFTNGAGDSPRQSFALTPDFVDYSFEFTPAAPIGKGGTDFIGLWPDPSGTQKTMDIERISVRLKPR